MQLLSKWKNQDCLIHKLALSFCQQNGFWQVIELAFPYQQNVDNI